VLSVSMICGRVPAATLFAPHVRECNSSIEQASSLLPRLLRVTSAKRSAHRSADLSVNLSGLRVRGNQLSSCCLHVVLANQFVPTDSSVVHMLCAEMLWYMLPLPTRDLPTGLPTDLPTGLPHGLPTFMMSTTSCVRVGLSATPAVCHSASLGPQVSNALFEVACMLEL